MSLCDTCTTPGACCQGFVLNIDFDAERWREDSERQMVNYGVPFFKATHPHPSGPDGRPDRTAVMFTCERLGPDGRCTDYYNRPQTCRDFAAGSDALCAMHVHKLKGIPIVVQRDAP